MLSPEGNVKKRVKELLEKYEVLPFKQAVAKIKEQSKIHGYYTMPSSSGYGEAGIADFLICIQGFYLEVETKTDKGKLRGIQKLHRDVVNAANGDYLVMKTEEDMKTLEHILSEGLKHFKIRESNKAERVKGMH